MWDKHNSIKMENILDIKKDSKDICINPEMVQVLLVYKKLYCNMDLRILE